MGRQARGVRAMNLDKEDFLIGMEVVEKEGLILSIAENGFGKRTVLENYRLTARGGKGVINMKTNKKTGNVVAILSVREDSEIIIVSQNGKIIRIEGSTIRQAGRSTSGVKLVSLEGTTRLRPPPSFRDRRPHRQRPTDLVAIRCWWC
jgi:DNA gyrase subunit A